MATTPFRRTQKKKMHVGKCWQMLLFENKILYQQTANFLERDLHRHILEE